MARHTDLNEFLQAVKKDLSDGVKYTNNSVSGDDYDGRYPRSWDDGPMQWKLDGCYLYGGDKSQYLILETPMICKDVVLPLEALGIWFNDSPRLKVQVSAPPV